MLLLVWELTLSFFQYGPVKIYITWLPKTLRALHLHLKVFISPKFFKSINLPLGTAIPCAFAIVVIDPISGLLQVLLMGTSTVLNMKECPQKFLLTKPLMILFTVATEQL